MGHDAYTAAAVKKIQPAGYRYVSESYEQFQLIYVSGGKLNVWTPQGASTLGDGELVLLRQSSRFGLSCGRQGYHGVGFLAIGQLPSQWIGAAQALRASPEIRALATLIERQIASPTPEATAVLEGLGRALTWEALRLDEEHRRCAEPARAAAYWAAAARSAVLATLHTSMPIRKVLQSVPLSYRHTCRLFRQTFGLSPKRFQLQAKIDRAQSLLHDTAMSVTDIALELGFASSQHLATQFRTVAGVSPQRWRQATARKSSRPGRR